MSYSVSNLGADLAAAFHGTTLNQIQNLYGIYNRAARTLLADVDPQETKRIVQVAGSVFNGVWDYPVAADLKGNKIIDMYPQVNRYPWDVWSNAYNQDFDRTKGVPWSNDMFSVLFNTGVKTVRINAPFFVSPIVLDYANFTQGWTAGGGATTPTLDTVNFAVEGGSLLFNIAAGQASGSLSKTLDSPIDLTSHLNLSTLFLYTYLPVPASISSVVLRWGSSAGNYYQVTATVTQQNTAFQQGWNLLAFPWLGATVVGSPVVSAIQYVDVIWNTDSTLQTGVRLNDINSNLGSILMQEYYSKYLFRSQAGVWQETVLADTDLINLDTDSYMMYFNIVAHLCAQQLQGLDAMFYDGNFFLDAYMKSVANYKNMYPSEIQLPQASYYKVRKPRRIPGWRQGF